MATKSQIHEPARSYDIGEYLWSISSKIGGPEYEDLESLYRFEIDQTTAQLGFDRIEAHFNEELLKWKPFPKTFEPVFTNTQTGRIYTHETS